MHNTTFLSILATATVLAACCVITPADAQSIDLSPVSPDAWYTHYSSLAHKPHGTLLKKQNITNKVTAPNYTTYRILYTSRDKNKRPIVASGLVQYPTQWKKYRSSARHVVINNYYLNSLTPACSPSWMFQDKNPKVKARPGVFSQGQHHHFSFETLYPQSQHWTLFMPDFLGPYSTYGVNHTSAHIILDGMLALTRSMNSLAPGFPTPDFGVQGFSGGAMATGAAAILLPSYTPQLKRRISSFVMGGTPADTVAMVDTFLPVADRMYTQRNNPNLPISLMYAVGLAREYPQFARMFTQSLTPTGRKTVHAIKNMCLPEVTQYVTQRNLSMRDITRINWVSSPLMRRYSAQESLIYWRSTPTRYPHYYSYFGYVENLVRPDRMMALTHSWRNHQLFAVDFVVPGVDHISAQPGGVGKVMEIMEKEFRRQELSH